MIENLVLEGGGVKVLAFCGALEELNKRVPLNDIKRIAGSSGGAIVAGVIACGYDPTELKELMTNKDFKDFKDDSWGIIRDIWRLFKRYGIYKGELFYEWYGEQLEKKTGNADITFKEVYEKYGKILVINGACLNRRQTHYYHHESNPNMPIRKAVLISMSIPLAFQAIKWQGDILVDGGTFENYPLGVFDIIGENGKVNLPNTRNGPALLGIKGGNKKTLGLKLITPAEQVGGGMVYSGNDRIGNIVEFITALINSFGSHIENLYIRPGYWERTVSINTGKIGTMQFVLSREEKDFLISEGRKGVEKFFSKNEN